MVGFRVVSFRVSLVLLLMVQIFGALCLWALAVTILGVVFFMPGPCFCRLHLSKNRTLQHFYHVIIKLMFACVFY